MHAVISRSLVRLDSWKLRINRLVLRWRVHQACRVVRGFPLCCSEDRSKVQRLTILFRIISRLGKSICHKGAPDRPSPPLLG